MAARLIAALLLIAVSVTELTAAALELTAQQRPLAKGVGPERFIDVSLSRDLERSNFFALPNAAT